MNTVFVRTLLPIFLTFLLLMLILWIIFSTGLGISIADWNRTQEEVLARKLNSLLSDMYNRRPYPDNEILFPVLDSLLPEDGFLVIVDRDKNPIFSYRNRQRKAGQENQISWAQNYMFRHYAEITFRELEPVGFFFFGETGSRNNAGSRRLLSAINLTFTWGIFISGLLSFLFAFFFSRSFSRKTIDLMKGIEEIAAGRLEYHINETGPRELAMIAQSANSLGKKLKNEGELRSRWTQDITHDLRTPLSALRAQLEGMRDGVLTLEPGRFGIVLEELGRIEDLVQDFNQLMTLESPEMKVRRETIKTRDFLDELIQIFSLSAKEKEITMTAESKITAFPGDRQLLVRAVSNLMSNAIRYTEKGGTVHITVAVDGEGITISVFNTGNPIPQEEMPFIFNRLYRGEYARTTKGSGLGLSIVKRIAELHGGSVAVTSREETGTTFFVTIPIQVS